MDQPAIVALCLRFNLIQKRKRKEQQKFNQMKKRKIQMNLLKIPIIETPLIYIPAIINPFVPLYSRSIWAKPRSTENWDVIVNFHYTDANWIENFCMRKCSFMKLVNLLREELEPREQFLKPRDPLSTEKQVAVAVYKLCSCSEYRVVGSIFGIQKSTVMKCVYRVVRAINKVMLKTYIHMPNNAEAKVISDNFENMTKLPMLIGVIDGSHIPILPPSNGYKDYINRKGWASYNLQALVDHRCRFLNICIKYPGSTHDATVFKGSNLYKYYDKIIPKQTKNFHGQILNYMIMGDPAYPLLDWVLKGFPGTVSAEEESFNTYLNSGRVVVEWTFGRLKGRFRILCKRIDINYKFVPEVVAATCILHNFLEDEKEAFIPRWMKDVQQAEVVLPQPIRMHIAGGNINAQQKRLHLCGYLANNFPLRSSKLR